MNKILIESYSPSRVLRSTAAADPRPGADKTGARWPDAELVERIKRGDEVAFGALLERYQGKVYRLALSLTKRPEDAEEVLQDVFLTVHRKLPSFEGRSAFSTWLYRITVNAALMKLRGKGRDDESLEAYLPQFTEDGRHARMVLDFTQGPEEALLRKEREQIIRAAIDALPPDYKVVLVLRDIEGLSNQEVTEILGAAVPAVKSRLHRARLALRERLAVYVEGGRATVPRRAVSDRPDSDREKSSRNRSQGADWILLHQKCNVRTMRAR